MLPYKLIFHALGIQSKAGDRHNPLRALSQPPDPASSCFLSPLSSWGVPMGGCWQSPCMALGHPSPSSGPFSPPQGTRIRPCEQPFPTGSWGTGSIPWWEGSVSSGGAASVTALWRNGEEPCGYGLGEQSNFSQGKAGWIPAKLSAILGTAI